MDWNFIKLFLAVQRSENMAAAAVTLNVSESTLFRQLSSLEAECGKVFVRYGRGYALTERGQELLPYALAIEQSFNDVSRHIYKKDDKEEGNVVITAPTSFSYRYLPAIIERFNNDYPSIRIELRVSNSSLNLSARQADIALRVTHSPPEHFVGREVNRIGWHFYASERYLAQFGRPKTFTELHTHKILGAAGELQSHAAYRWLENRLSEAINTRVDDLVAMSECVKSDSGIALLPNEFNERALIPLFPFDELAPNTLWILIHKDMRDVARIKRVMQYLYQQLNALTF